jgi:hypothetical protein
VENKIARCEQSVVAVIDIVESGFFNELVGLPGGCPLGRRTWRCLKYRFYEASRMPGLNA